MTQAAKKTGTQTSRAARKELETLTKRRDKLLATMAKKRDAMAAKLLAFDAENDPRIERLESIVKQEEGAL